MLLQYQCVSLNLLAVQEYSKEAIYEDHNYIGTKVKIIVRAVYNPATQSDGWVGPAQLNANNKVNLPYVPAQPNAAAANPPGPLPRVVGAPQFGPAGGPSFPGAPVVAGVPAALSDVALRHALMQPRGQLIFSIGGVVNIFSPMQGMPTDVTGGPFPLFCNVVEMQGLRTWLVDYGITTTINECPLYGRNPPALLSHVWEMHHELDEHYFTKRIMRGRAVFRQDSLTRMGVEPDNYRGILGVGIPNNGKRESIKVWVGQPRNVVHYETVDRQLPVGWSQAGVTKVVASQKITLAKDAFADALEKVNIEKPGTALELMKSHAPVNIFSFNVEVWGGFNILRVQLEAFARLIIAAREQAIILQLQRRLVNADNKVDQAVQNAIAAIKANATASWQWDIEHDIMGKHVKVHKTFVTGPINQLLGGGFANANISTSLGMPTEDSTIVTINGVPTALLTANSDTPDVAATVGTKVSIPGPPGDFNMRGSYLGQCVAAALQRSCETPPAPQTAPNPGMIASPVPPYLTSYENPYTY